ncbi:uncharacterized protein VP01_10187g1 [Puccinia sorghi]|uniref:Uncharacterized protein n=1 Tax=Puccinia sorghi TaxID=27349 RepID=A0A0L6VUZ5_9BASI|nr:uncharacterized protein VP01_10187g1 [Puccinia sorghi]
MKDAAPDVGGAPGSPKGQKRSLVSWERSDVELVSAPVSIHKLPAQKLPRSPSYGDGVAHTLSRLTFNHNHSPKRDSYSPPRKVAGSRGSSNASLTELQQLNFPLPIARQLTRAMDLEKTHAGVDESHSTGC